MLRYVSRSGATHIYAASVKTVFSSKLDPTECTISSDFDCALPSFQMDMFTPGMATRSLGKWRCRSSRNHDTDARRGTGVSDELKDYAMDFMRRHEVQFAHLSVSLTNARALAFYHKHGWKDLGLRPGRDNVNLMEHDVPTNVGSNQL